MAIYEGFAPTYRQAWFYDVSKEEEESHAAYKRAERESGPKQVASRWDPVQYLGKFCNKGSRSQIL